MQLAHWHNLVWQSMQSAWLSIRGHGFRSVLTVLGIIIGVAAVIAVIAMMNGLSSGIRAQLDDLGSEMTTIRAITSAEQQMLGQQNKLSEADVELLRAKVPAIAELTVSMPAYSFGLTAVYGRKSSQTQLIGADSAYQRVIRMYPAQGRFISKNDDEKRRKVVVIGPSLIKKLDLPAQPIGEFILLSGDWFRIIGVGETRGSLFGIDQDNYLITPFSTVKAMNGTEALQVEIAYELKANADETAVQQQIRQLLRQRAKLAPDAPEHIEFITAEKTREQFGKVLNSVTTVAAAVVGVSLLVGGIGVMNIMWVSVTERTREIGIVKALGASPAFILWQFLFEAVALSLMGGLIGLVLGVAIAWLVSSLFSFGDIELLPWSAGVLALGFTSLIGIVFGLAPALKAARLEPVDALRYE